MTVTTEIEHDTATTAGERLVSALAVSLESVSKDTAERLQSGVRERIRRQTSGTGRTEAAVTVEKVDGGYLVTSGNMGDRSEMLPVWLEHGTKHMTARPAWRAAAQLEEGTHRRRVEEAMAASAEGLGA